MRSACAAAEACRRHLVANIFKAKLGLKGFEIELATAFQDPASKAVLLLSCGSLVDVEVVRRVFRAGWSFMLVKGNPRDGVRASLKVQGGLPATAMGVSILTWHGAIGFSLQEFYLSKFCWLGFQSLGYVALLIWASKLHEGLNCEGGEMQKCRKVFLLISGHHRQRIRSSPKSHPYIPWSMVQCTAVVLGEAKASVHLMA